jgi:hypothetical protein
MRGHVESVEDLIRTAPETVDFRDTDSFTSLTPDRALICYSSAFIIYLDKEGQQKGEVQ